MTDAAYRLVQPYVDGARRFHEATVVSAHETLEDAYAELLRIATELQSHGLAPNVLELYIVDGDRTSSPCRVLTASFRTLMKAVEIEGRRSLEGGDERGRVARAVVESENGGSEGDCGSTKGQTSGTHRRDCPTRPGYP